MVSKCIQCCCLLAALIFVVPGSPLENNSTQVEPLNAGFGYELVQERLENVQLSFLEVFLHVKELGETVLNNQRTIEQNQQQMNQLMYHYQKQITNRVEDLQLGVASNVTLVANYSKQILDLQTICSNHDTIRKELTNLMSDPSSLAKSAVATNIKSCKTASSKSSGIFNLQLSNSTTPVSVFCEMQRFGGGWLVIQQRFSGSVSFYRGWSEYREGFGVVGEEFWLGLETIHQVTKQTGFELMVELEDFSEIYKYAYYSEFELGSEAEKYSLVKLGSYRGTADDSLVYHKGMKFSTFDSDNDEGSENCAKKFSGAWWYKDCYYSNLNGQHANHKGGSAINWQRSTAWSAGLKYTRLMIREK